MEQLRDAAQRIADRIDGLIEASGLLAGNDPVAERVKTAGYEPNTYYEYRVQSVVSRIV